MIFCGELNISHVTYFIFPHQILVTSTVDHFHLCFEADLKQGLEKFRWFSGLERDYESPEYELCENISAKITVSL
jgi:hypothetical protein